MPIIFVGEAPSREVYEAVSRAIDMQAERPDGLVLHSASEEPGGTVRTVTVWESEEHARAFERDRLFSAMDGSGMHDRNGGPQPVVYEPFDYVA